VTAKPNLRHSVFRARRPGDPGQACVLVNFGTTPLDAEIDWGAKSGWVEICQPFEADRVARLPVTVRLPPESCAVVVELHHAARPA
jgi:hypothetical protein